MSFNTPKPILRSVTKALLWQVAGVGEEEDAEPTRGHDDGLRGHDDGLRGHEDERIAAILERIQAIKPEYKHR